MPKSITITPYQLAQRFLGMSEVSGGVDNPQILSMLRLDAKWPSHDEVPWCSAFVNYICWLLRLPRSKDLRARSWLKVGYAPQEAASGFDVAILQRGNGPQPGPEIIDAQGHVGFFSGFEKDTVRILGGNQGNAVNIKSFPDSRVLGIRRLL